MAKISTKELFDNFFAEKAPETAVRTRPQIDRPEVYEYEAKIGKQLIEMNVDELFEMVLSFNNNRATSGAYSISYSSFSQIFSMYRSLFNFYIDNYEIIRNPFNDKRMKGTQAAQRLAQSKEPFTWKNVEEAIAKVHESYEFNKANYIECILLLYYNGFSKAEEIASLTENMIDFKNKSVMLPGRTLKLSDRCFELLTFVHGLTSLEGWKYDYLVKSWRGSYFKYIIRPKEEANFDDRPLSEIGNLINRRILTDVKKKFGLDINYRILYLLGFYDKVVEQYGEKRAYELITSVRNSKNTEDLMKIARDYGVVVDNVTVLKRLLRPFIKN